MSGFNKIILMGNLTRDPETRSVGDATVTEFGLAVNHKYFSKAAGEMREDVCFVDVAFWGRRGEAIAQYLGKGDPIHVEGRLAFRTWEDKETGDKRSKHSIVGDGFTFVGGGKGGKRQGNDEEVPF